MDPEPGAPIGSLDGGTLPPVAELSEEDRRRLLDAAVIARATPRQKLELIELHQRHGEVVAMTGDGVNDAPALHKADIGIAMGVRGTAVAREAADMVPGDDELGTLVVAVAEGRAIFANIRKFVVYLMSCNVSEIFAVALGALAQLGHVFSMRNPDSGWIRNEVTRNPWISAALVLCIGLLAMAVHGPPFAAILSLEPPGAAGWSIAIAASFAPAVVGQVLLARRRHSGPDRKESRP